VWKAGGAACAHSKEETPIVSLLVTKNSLNSQLFAATGILSVNNLYIIYKNKNTPIKDNRLPKELT